MSKVQYGRVLIIMLLKVELIDIFVPGTRTGRRGRSHASCGVLSFDALETPFEYE